MCVCTYVLLCTVLVYLLPQVTQSHWVESICVRRATLGKFNQKQAGWAGHDVAQVLLVSDLYLHIFGILSSSCQVHQDNPIPVRCRGKARWLHSSARLADPTNLIDFNQGRHTMPRYVTMSRVPRRKKDKHERHVLHSQLRHTKDFMFHAGM